MWRIRTIDMVRYKQTQNNMIPFLVWAQIQMLLVLMSQGTVVFMFAILLRMSSTAVKNIRDCVKVLLVNSTAK